MDLDDEELKATRRMNGSDKNVVCMERNIKILENLLEEGFEAMCYSEAHAIEHLIKAYKEEKEENESADRVNKALIKQMERNNNIIEDLTNKISELQEEIKDERYFNKHNVEVYEEKTKNSIPVSLVKEKIEEIDKEIEYQKLYGNVAKREKLETKKEHFLEILESEEVFYKNY